MGVSPISNKRSFILPPWRLWMTVCQRRRRHRSVSLAASRDGAVDVISTHTPLLWAVIDSLVMVICHPSSRHVTFQCLILMLVNEISEVSAGVEGTIFNPEVALKHRECCFLIFSISSRACTNRHC